jgi:hypothetical protein
LLSNTVSGTATLALYSDSGLEPDTLVGTLTSPASYSTTLASTTFTTSGITLTANTNYWLVLKANGGTFNWAWTSDNTGTGVGFQHTYGETDNSGGTWYTFDTFPPQFTVTADASTSSAGVLAFASSTYSVSEGGGSATINLVRTGGSAGAVTVTVSATGGTATSGTDYTGLPATVTFANGQTTASATVTIVDDSTVEGDETAVFTLGSATGGATLGSPATATLTIVDNDAPTTWTKLTAAASGSGTPTVVVYSADGTVLRTFQPYAAGFTGPVSVATADVTGDGMDDIITGAGTGGGPHVEVFDGATGTLVRSFLAYDGAFRGGVSVAAGDFNGDGVADIVTGAGAGGGPHVEVFDGSTVTVIRSFLAYDGAFRGSVSVAAADLTGDGKAEVVTGTGSGGGPHVKVYDGAAGAVSLSFLAYDPTFLGGVSVAAAATGSGSMAAVLTGPGSGAAGQVKVYGATGTLLRSFYPFGSDFLGGVRVAAD